MIEMIVNDLFADRYRLLREVGSGAFGEVWLVRDEQLDLEMALKVYISLDEKGIDEFKSEYKTTYGLNHPNLLKANHFDVFGKRPYLSMPYCPVRMADLVGSIDEKMFWKFLRDVSAGLAYLHERDILHRDIKPDNILQNAEGDFVITDFGISLRMRSTLRRNSTRMKVADSSGGTYAYMGPELFSSHPEAVKATDIWALGVTLHELLSGELPFVGQGGGMLLRGAEVPDLPDRFAGDVNATVRACLSKDTWDRPTAMQLHEYAEAKVAGRDVSCPWGNGVQPTEIASEKDAGAGKVPSGEAGSGKPAAERVEEPARLHGFVRFWIWLMIVLQGLSLIMASWEWIAKPGHAAPFGGSYDLAYYLDWRMTSLQGIVSLLGCLMLWKRLRLGYWVIVGTSIIGGSISKIVLGQFGEATWIAMILGTFIGGGILFGILQIRKNGISAWKAMQPGSALGRMKALYSAVVLIFIVFAVIPTGLSRAAASDYRDYSILVSQCKALVEEGNASEPMKLVEARLMMEGVKEYEEKYGAMDEKFDRSLTVNTILQAKCKKAAEEWMTAAKAQERVGNQESSAEYVRLAQALMGEEDALDYYRYR